MPQTTLYDRPGKSVGNVDLAEALFAAPVNEAVLHQAVVAQLAGRRLGTSDTKTRGEVRGGGKKPYRQKGTGRARQGSRTAPHYRGGGVVFGPHPRSYEQKLPKKMRRLALRSALTAKLNDDAIKVVDAFGMADEPKTKVFAGVLAALGAGDGHAQAGPRRGPGQGRAARAVRGEPAVGHRDPRRLAQRRGPAQRGRGADRAAGPGPDGGGVRVSALTAADIILRPVISEKSIDESGRGKYTFAVHDKANKIQIKAAVEELYSKEKVTVVAVNVLTTKSKEKRRGTKRGRITGYTSSWRKAIVTLAPGQKIEFFEGV